MRAESARQRACAANEPTAAARRPSSASSSAATSSTRSPCMSASTSARRTASRPRASASAVDPSAAAPSSSSARSRPFSPSSTAARSAAAQSPSPPPSSDVERLAQLLGAERLVLEERELPAVERLAELAVVVGERRAARAGRRARPPRNASSRVGSPRRLGRGDRQHGTDAERPPVEPLEEDRAGGDRAGGREPERGDGVGELAGRVGRLEPRRRQSVAPSSSTHRRSVSRPKLGAAAAPPPASARASSPAAAGRNADAAAELDVRCRLEADERRDRRVARGPCRRATARARRTRGRTRRRPSRSRRSASAVSRERAAAGPCGRAPRRRPLRSRVRAREDARPPARGRSSSSASPASLQRRERPARALDEVADERPVLVERRPVSRVACSSNANGMSAPLASSRAR